ncbi:helix-turn-helix domain-containing protein [Fictibacillus sp. NPDC058756]|uniref:helix-turn-helix domain-containing protein n=1 Tax=Fictibacillus sp. NPDC058756 TaxID=3346625 RepID=UPI003680264B
MIRTEAAYKKALLKLREDQAFIQNEKERFKQMGLTDEQVQVAIEPQISFHEQLKEEVEYYEKIKRGEFDPIINFTNIGKTLIAYRIYIGMSQQELASKMGVPDSQVSRDERNEYYGATKDRIEDVMEAMGMKTGFTLF